MNDSAPTGRLNVPSVPSQLQDIAEERSCWRAVQIDGAIAGAMGFNPASSAGGLYLNCDERWAIFWPVDREAFEVSVTIFLRGRFGTRPKTGGGVRH